MVFEPLGSSLYDFIKKFLGSIFGKAIKIQKTFVVFVVERKGCGIGADKTQ